jgi:cell division protein FtsB
VGPLLLVLAAGATLALDRETGLMQLLTLAQEVEEAEANLEGLIGRRDELRARARRLHQDPREIEWVAREQLGMVRPGEVVVRWSAIREGSD